MKKILYLVREDRFVQPDDPLRQVPTKKILLYVFCQAFGIAATVAISQTIAAIGEQERWAPPPIARADGCLLGFPVLIISLIPLRWNILPRFFTPQELHILDHLTADSDIILASMGGKPRMPGDKTVDVSGKSSDMSKEGTGSCSNENLSTAERGEATGGLRERITASKGGQMGTCEDTTNRIK